MRYIFRKITVYSYDEYDNNHWNVGNNDYFSNIKKQKNKTEKKDANIVRKRAKELGNMLGRKFI